MSKRMIPMFLFFLIVLAPVSHSEWQLQIYRDGEIDSFPVSEIDSLNVRFVPLVVDEMVKVPAGSFISGDGEASCSFSQVEVTLTRDFWLGQYEITNLQYLIALQWAYDEGLVSVTTEGVFDNINGSNRRLVMLANNDIEIQFDGVDTFYIRQSPGPDAAYAYPQGYDPANHPVNRITWYGAASYCDWLNLQAGLPMAYDHVDYWECNGGDPYGAVGYRLPTDAEWEYATQWESVRSYPWGDDTPDCDLANFIPGWFCVGWTVPVGSYPAAPELLGLRDMSGNVGERCNDWFSCGGSPMPTTDPVGPDSGSLRVARGGGFGNIPAHIRCAYRFGSNPEAGSGGNGFRIARTATVD
jgi:formylglycine-generating enzyme required for sulfatase activity